MQLTKRGNAARIKGTKKSISGTGYTRARGGGSVNQWSDEKKGQKKKRVTRRQPKKA